MYAKFPQLKLYYRMSGLEVTLPGTTCSSHYIHALYTGPQTEKKLDDQFPPNPELNDKVALWYGDITRLKVDTIVNAAHVYIHPPRLYTSP